MPATNPSLAEVLNGFRESIFRGLNVSLPARVERYDSSTQTIDAKPLIRGTFEEENGTISQDPLPVVCNVPVVFPGAGGFRLTFPVAVGDTVLLVFADRSLDAWISGGGETAPADLRRHALSDAVAIPGLHPSNAPWFGASTSDATLGKDGGPQAVFKATEIHLGESAAVPAVDAVVKGTTYRAAEDVLLSALLTDLSIMSAALTAAGSAINNLKMSADVWSDFAPLPAPNSPTKTAATVALALAAAANTAMTAAISAFQGAGATYLSPTVKTT